MRIHMQGFILRHGQKHRQGRTVANRYNTDKAESNPRASVGRRSANNIQQGQGREIIQVHSNNPNEVQTESER